MGLDVYVGSLARYYVGDWETVVQRIGREQGMEVQIRRPTPAMRSFLARIIERLIQSRRSGPAAAMRAVERWRQVLGRASNLGQAFEWNENLNYEYFTDKPAWDCYGALVLWACYDQLPAAHRANTALEWNSDAAYRTGLMLSDQRYRHLLADTEIWFPIEFAEPFGVTSIAGQPMIVGSSVQC
jgi:hypothetical protein